MCRPLAALPHTCRRGTDHSCLEYLKHNCVFLPLPWHRILFSKPLNMPISEHYWQQNNCPQKSAFLETVVLYSSFFSRLFYSLSSFFMAAQGLPMTCLEWASRTDTCCKPGDVAAEWEGWGRFAEHFLKCLFRRNFSFHLAGRRGVLVTGDLSIHLSFSYPMSPLLPSSSSLLSMVSQSDLLVIYFRVLLKCNIRILRLSWELMHL